MPKNLTRENLISFLIQIRKEAGMTQDQVANALGKPQSFVSKYENGERNLDFIEVIDVIEVLGLDPATKISKLISSQ
ncbi:MAG TPA: helix-turn-helix transcriptional regulator [Pseudomonadales bacterium]|nr:helix-turn-helix transcriptional regulator [Pseudomonadales bacterium]